MCVCVWGGGGGGGGEVKKNYSRKGKLNEKKFLHAKYVVLGPASPGSGRFYFVI